MTLPILYSGTKNASSWAMRAWLALTEASVRFEERVIDIRRPQRFLNLAAIAPLSPSRTVPLLVTDDAAIFDSLAIMEFANDMCAGKLLPCDATARAKARSVVAWQHAGLSGICTRISFESGFYPYKRELTPQEQAEAAQLFDHVERLFDECAGPFLFGDFSLADCMLAPTVVRLIRHNAALSRYPATEAWANAVVARESVAEWLRDADRLPHIWFDEYLVPGSKPELSFDWRISP